MTYKTFGFTEQQILIRDQVLKLLQRVAPDSKLDEWETNSAFPEEAYQALAAEGYLALPFAEEYGGSNAGHRDLAVFIEALGYHHPGIASAYMTTVIYGGMYIQYFGSPEMKREFLPKIIAGKLKMAVAYTEPSGGSDMASIKTRAVRDGDDYVVNGQKVYITNAHVADALAVMAKTKPDGGHKGLSVFIVDAKSPGITIRPLNPMGRRTSLPNEIFFDGVRVPANRLIGEENEGWRKMMRGLNLERVLLGASSAGQCLKIVDIARDWAKQRVAFGKTITEYQAISHKFADMMMLTESVRLHTYTAADMLDQGVEAVLETSMAKTVATENNLKVADLGVQVMGGAGYMDGPMSRLYRDARVGTIGGGSSEIMRNVIARLMGIE